MLYNHILHNMLSSTPSQHVHSLSRSYLKNEHGLVLSMEGSKVTLLMHLVQQKAGEEPGNEAKCALHDSVTSLWFAFGGFVIT